MEPQTSRSRTIRGFVVRMLLMATCCYGTAYFGHTVLGHIPIANWMLGALAALLSMALWLDC